MCEWMRCGSCWWDVRGVVGVGGMLGVWYWWDVRGVVVVGGMLGVWLLVGC